MLAQFLLRQEHLAAKATDELFELLFIPLHISSSSMRENALLDGASSSRNHSQNRNEDHRAEKRDKDSGEVQAGNIVTAK